MFNSDCPAQIGSLRIVGHRASQEDDGEEIVENSVTLARGKAED